MSPFVSAQSAQSASQIVQPFSTGEETKHHAVRSQIEWNCISIPIKNAFIVSSAGTVR